MRRTVLICCTLLTLAAAAPGFAEDGEELGWADTAELTFVSTAGNSEAQTLGFKNKLTRTWSGARFTLEAAGLRAETTSTSYRVEGTAADFRVVEVSDIQVTAENYLLRGRYDRDFHDGWFWLAGAGWERNQFAGFDDRYSAVAGVGRTWFAGDDARLRTDLGLTYTREEVELSLAGGSRRLELAQDFAGLRFSWDYLRKLTATTTYTNVFYIDENLDDTADLRGDMTQAVAVAMSERLALKASLQLLYDHQPGLIGVETPAPPGGVPGRAFVERDELDSVLSVALVVDL